MILGKDSNGQAVQYNNNNDISKKGGPQAEEFTPPDGGWGWVVCFASFWVNGTIFGMLNTFGVLLPEISKLGGEQQNVTTKVCRYSVTRIFAVLVTKVVLVLLLLWNVVKPLLSPFDEFA